MCSTRLAWWTRGACYISALSFMFGFFFPFGFYCILGFFNQCAVSYPIPKTGPGWGWWLGLATVWPSSDAITGPRPNWEGTWWCQGGARYAGHVARQRHGCCGAGLRARRVLAWTCWGQVFNTSNSWKQKPYKQNNKSLVWMALWSPGPFNFFTHCI